MGDIVRDSNGRIVEIGDVIECPEVDRNHAERYHVCFHPSYCGYDAMEIRDLGNNNLYMYTLHGPYYVIGKWYEHLDKLSDDDLVYYFSDEMAKRIRELSGEREGGK